MTSYDLERLIKDINHEIQALRERRDATAEGEGKNVIRDGMMRLINRRDDYERQLETAYQSGGDDRPSRSVYGV
jgi:hypothetical protein